MTVKHSTIPDNELSFLTTAEPNNTEKHDEAYTTSSSAQVDADWSFTETNEGGRQYRNVM